MSKETRKLELSGRRGFQSLRERIYHLVFLVFAAVTVLTTIAIILSLLSDGLDFFLEYSVWQFVTGFEWSPVIRPVTFGILPLVFGTLVVTVTAALIAVPIGVLTAIYLSEYASARTRSVLKPLLEILAGIPTVVYGFFGLVYITPFFRATIFPSIATFNVLSASIVVGIMIIPMVSSISEDAMSAVPNSLREAGYGLGATKFSVSVSVVVPAAISGIVSSVILALSRAIGETMAVTVAMGLQPKIPPVQYTELGIPFIHPADVFLESGQTMTAAMVQISQSDITGGSLAYKSLFAIGLTLFLITLAMNIVSNFITEHYREAY